MASGSGVIRGRHYKAEWENLDICKGWLTKRVGEPYCLLCKCTITCHLGAIKKHRGTAKHERLFAASSMHKPITDSFQKKESESEELRRKRLELSLALHTAVSNSIVSIDPLADILKREVGEERVQMHRTKCTALIKKVLAPHFKHVLKRDMEGAFFSLLADESTDISVTKLLGISVKYYSATMNKIVTTYLGLEEVPNGEAVSLHHAVKAVMRKWDLSPDCFIGLGTDGANAMMGSHHSLLSLLKDDYPQITHLRCVCHAFDLIAKDAMKVMPSHIETMIRETHTWFSIRETHTWFSQSSLRQAAYREVLDLVGFQVILFSFC